MFDINPALWEIIIKSTKLRINERYPDAYELKKALDSVGIVPEPIAAPDGSPDEDPAHGSCGNAADIVVSIKTTRSGQSFLRRHLRTMIGIACGLLAAAVIIPLAIRAYRPTGNRTTPFQTAARRVLRSATVRIWTRRALSSRCIRA